MALLIKTALTQINIPKIATRIIWALAILMIFFWGIILSISEKQVKLKRDWDMEVLTTGYKFTWTYQGRDTNLVEKEGRAR